VLFFSLFCYFSVFVSVALSPWKKLKVLFLKEPSLGVKLEKHTVEPKSCIFAQIQVKDLLKKVKPSLYLLKTLSSIGS